jgi:serine/threonine-protein kinase
LSGRAAFAGATVTDTLAAILDRQPDWSAVSAQVPRRIRRLLQRCLAKDVNKRLQHIGDARLELEETDDYTDERSAARGLRAPPALLVGAVLFIAGAVGLTSWFLRARTPVPAMQATARLTLNLQGDLPADTELQVNRFFVPFAISPDGQQVVFRARNATASQLFLRELSGFDVKALQGTEQATTPFFSPDGRWIGFWRAEDRVLRKVAVAGGSPIEIGQTDVPIHAVWQSDDEILLQTGSSNKELWSIPASGGKPREITIRDRSPGERISLRTRVPGGNDLLIATRGPAGNWLQVLSRETGTRRRLLNGGTNVLARYTSTGHLVYSDGDALFAVALDRRHEPVSPPVPVLHGIDHWFWHSNVALSANGTVAYLPVEGVREAELVWVNDAGRSTPVAGGRGAFSSVALSPDGREVATDIVDDAKSQVWIFDLVRGTKRLLDGEGDTNSPVWSRDGVFITYVSRRNGSQALYRTRANGTGPREYLISRPDGYPEPTDWSPDGRTLLFSEYTERGDTDVWMYSSGRVTRYLASGFTEQSATFSPDGGFVAYAADDGGMSHVYVQAFPGPGPRTVVSAEEGGLPRWSADGASLFFKSGRRIMSVGVQTTPSLRIGQPKVWADPGLAFGGYAFTGDNRRFLAIADRATESPLELRVILNWFQELNRLVPHP